MSAKLFTKLGVQDMDEVIHSVNSIAGNRERGCAWGAGGGGGVRGVEEARGVGGGGGVHDGPYHVL